MLNDRDLPALPLFRTSLRRTGRWAARSCALLGILVLAFLSNAPALAHDVSSPIAGTQVTVQTQGDSSTWQFSFSTIAQEALSLGHDPTLDPTSLLVRGEGANAGRTELIRLDPLNWSFNATSGEYEYSDPSGVEGGVTSAAMGTGSLSIVASGANWSWSVAGAQDEVWVEFWIGEELFCAEFSSANATVTTNAAGDFSASNAAAPLACQEPVCGNGVHELGEECDDGNFDDGDGCTSECFQAACQTQDYASTWEGIQSVVIQDYNCGFCHGSAPLGNSLDLSPGVAYQNLVNVSAANFFTDHDLVEPGEPIASFLYEKLAAATNGSTLPSGQGNGMPQANAPLTSQHLEAVSKWIRGGAPETGVVEGTAELLAACLPPPTPLKIPRPDPPAAGTGVQIVQTPWPLPAQNEDEICMTTYYDFASTDLVPAEFQLDCPGAFGVNNPSEKCFLYHGRTLRQDPQSHHSIIHIYQGDSAVDAVAASGRQFGPFTYKNGPQVGQTCDPKAVDLAAGYNPDCSGPVVSTIACSSQIGNFGPGDFNNNVNAPAFGGSQEPYSDTEFASGVYSILPMSGVVVWNSHAFNLSDTDSSLDQYLNIRFANADDRLYPVRGIFDAGSIFSENVPPYQTQEVCRTYTIEQGANLFNLNSHTHQRGVKWRTWEPPNAVCYPDSDGNGCTPGDPSQLIYLSTDYTDPVQLKFDPPVVYDSPNEADRTFLYCSLYDNGSAVSSPEVKRQSTSPNAPLDLNVFIPSLGGPCAEDVVACFGGADAGALCGGDGTVCESGICDACPLRGGVTTEDEMFILIGSYFVKATTPDADGDGVGDDVDNCPDVANAEQENLDSDLEGDACDADDDNDGFSDAMEASLGTDALDAASVPSTSDPATFAAFGGYTAYIANPDNSDLFAAGVCDETAAFEHWRDGGFAAGRGFADGQLRTDNADGSPDSDYAIDGGFSWEYPGANTVVFITADAPKPEGWDGRFLLLERCQTFNIGSHYTAQAYRTINVDVAQAIDGGLIPGFDSVTDHYVKYGFKEGRLTNSDWTQAELEAWDDAGYFVHNQDVETYFLGAQSEGWVAFGKIGFAHYINFGRYEGRNDGQPAVAQDSDGDGVPDSSDAFPEDPSESVDTDQDGVGDNADNCPADANADQADSDMDGIGDVCDSGTPPDPTGSFAISMQTNSPLNSLSIGDSFGVDIILDANDSGITLLSVGVIFDDSVLSYDQAASTTTSYILYGGKGGGGYMKASSTCGGNPQTAPAGCSLRVGTTNQVNVDFVSVDLTNGTQNTGTVQLATLVFNVVDLGLGSSRLFLSMTSPGNVFAAPGGGTHPVDLGEDIQIQTSP